ncbi:UNVERIFIED_CONTAM: hypothetical protein Slati_0432900 [Sesamum latifolium]|uniref:Reverse transcriptase zinc-binding domain-containing protein n=1 Tax=Sesamum latifolium TaxID=2727402 RepID=A0AAW2XYM9_9LAMI
MEAKVSELLDENGEWKVDLLHTVFLPEYAEAILGITRSLGGQDSIRWHYERNGRYSVKSAYHLLSKGLWGRAQGGASGSTSYRSDSWSFIWTAKVPPKVRMFAWRVCRNSLPTVMNLARRGVTVSGACPWCGDESEDVLHCLLGCPFARLVWALSDLPWAYICCNDSNPEVWIRGLNRNLDGSAFARALLLCWLL